MEALLGEYAWPVIAVDPGRGEWLDTGMKAFSRASDLATYIASQLREGERPEPILAVTQEAGPATFRYVWESELPCTIVVDEVDLWAPNRGKTNEHLFNCLKRGRKIGGSDSDSSISVIAGAHAGQDVDRRIARFAAHVVFRQSEPSAIGRAEKYIHSDVDVSRLAEYEFTLSRKAEALRFDVGTYGPFAYTLNPDKMAIERTSEWSSGERTPI